MTISEAIANEAWIEKLWKLTERYEGERDVYVYAASKAQALARARAGLTDDEGEPSHFNYRYTGPVTEVAGPPPSEEIS